MGVDPRRLAERVAPLAPILLGLAAAVLFGALAAAPRRAWPWTLRESLAFPWAWAAGTAVLAALALAWRDRWPAAAFRALAAATFGVLYAFLPVAGLGDGDTWSARSWDAGIPGSEVLGNLLLHLAREASVDPGWVAPAAGAGAAWAWLWAVDVLGADDPGRRGRSSRTLGVLLLAGSGVHGAFGRGYVENTQAAALPLLAALAVTVAYVRDGRPGADRRAFLSGLFFALAALAHGAATFFLPAPAMALALRRARTGTARALAADAAGMVLGAAAAAGLAALAVWGTGHGLEPGNSTGGGDGLRFVPMRLEPTPFQEFTMLSAGHLLMVANAVMAVFPLLPVAAWALVRRQAVRSPATDDAPAEAARGWATLAALAGLAFVCLWNFDLGWPADHDLVAIPLMPLSVVLADAVLRAGPRGRAGRVALGAAALLYGGLVTGLLAR